MNKNSIIGFVLIGVIMFGFTWYQNKEYQKQAAVQAQLDSIALAEQMAAMAIDSGKRAEGLVADGNMAGVKVTNMPAYKDSLLTEARLAQEGFYKLANDKVEVFYQPIYSTAAQSFTSAEALVRIRDKEDKLINDGIL